MKYSIVLWIFKGILLMTITCAHLSAQTYSDYKPIYNWAMVSVGTGSNGLSASVNHSFLINHIIIKSRFLYTEEFNILEFSHQVWDLGILAGFVKKGNNYMLAGSGGLSLTGGIKKGDEFITGGWFGNNYQPEKYTILGLPLQIDLSIRISRIFGGVVTLYGNLNPERSIAGAMIGLKAGRIWD